MQTITCKYLGPTNTKGTRIKATCEGGSITVSREYGSSIEANYMRAAQELKQCMGWDGKMIGGHINNGDGMVFVFAKELYTIE